MLGRGHFFKWYMGIFLVFLYAPAILLPVFAFNDSSVVSFPLKGFTTKWFTVLQTTDSLHVAVRNSLMIAVTTAIFSTLFGVLAARASTRFSFPGRRSIMGFIMLPMVLPEIIICLGSSDCVISARSVGSLTGSCTAGVLAEGAIC